MYKVALFASHKPGLDIIKFLSKQKNLEISALYLTGHERDLDKKMINYIKNLESKKNLILVTHYVFISEVLNYGPSSGEIVVSDKNLNIIGSIEIDF